MSERAIRMTELPRYTVADPDLLHALRAGELDPLILRDRLIAGVSDPQAIRLALYDFQEGAAALRWRRVIIEGATVMEATPYQTLAVFAAEENDSPGGEAIRSAGERPEPAGPARKPRVRILVDPPPRLLTRCATSLLSASSTNTDATRLFDAWRDDDRRWLAWYERQPAAWLKEHHHVTARRCRQRLEPPVTFADELPRDTRVVPVGTGGAMVMHGLFVVRKRIP